MTIENALRWLDHEAALCRDRDTSEALCLLLPSLRKSFDLAAAFAFRISQRQTWRWWTVLCSNPATVPDCINRPEGCQPLQDLARELCQVRALLEGANLHAKDVLRRYGIARRTLYRLVAAGRIPAPVRICGPLWRLADLEAAEKAGQVRRRVSG